MKCKNKQINGKKQTCRNTKTIKTVQRQINNYKYLNKNKKKFKDKMTYTKTKTKHSVKANRHTNK